MEFKKRVHSNGTFLDVGEIFLFLIKKVRQAENQDDLQPDSGQSHFTFLFFFTEAEGGVRGDGGRGGGEGGEWGRGGGNVAAPQIESS